MVASASASSRAAVSASDVFERCEAFTSGDSCSHENKMRTLSQWGGKSSWPPPRLTRVNHAMIRNFQRFPWRSRTIPARHRATEAQEKVTALGKSGTQPFGQYTKIRVDVISRPANP